MKETKNKLGTQVSRQNISYYNEIAGEYDAMLHKDDANTIIRAKVAAAFTRLVKSGRVLDFGGGTGQDLGWLLQHHYQVYFCEPSAAMRHIAMERGKTFPGAALSFLDDYQADFRNWHSAFPFADQMDAVLADFAVINCIPDITLLFEKLSLAVKPGGNIIALLLDYSVTKKFRSNLKGTVQAFFSGDPVKIYIDYHGQRQLVYLHTTKAIKKALAGYFEFSRAERLAGMGFSLLHLVRK